MNFLELCQDLRAEAGISGSGPATVIGQEGEYARVVEWVKRAVIEIEGKHHSWDFLWARFQIQTAEVPPSSGLWACDYDISQTDVNRFWTESFTIFDPTVGEKDDESRLPWYTYREWRKQEGYGEDDPARPKHVIQLPNRTLRFHPDPDKQYTIQADYWRKPKVLAADSDVPYIPEQHHKLVTYLAMQYYARYENAPEVMAGALSKYNIEMANMERDYLDDIVFRDVGLDQL